MKLPLLILAVLLSGCGTKIIIPIDDTQLNEDEATVIIYHEQGFSDEFTVLLDKTTPVGIVTAERPLKFSVAPGEHELHTEIAMVIDRVTKMNFYAGKTYFFKIWLDLGMWVHSIRISPAVAIKEYLVVSHRDEEIAKHQEAVD